MPDVKVMQNPLADLERRVISQNFGHDIRGPLGNLFHLFFMEGMNAPVYNPAWGLSNVIHIKNSIAALENLVADDVYLQIVTSEDIALRLEQNRAAIRKSNGDIQTYIQNLTDFKTQIDVLGLALYTLIANSAMQVPHGKGKIIITASDYDGEASDLVYQNPIAPVSGKFKRFRVQDTGQGFPYGTEFLKMDESELQYTHGHFGLRLTRMICKYLMSHFSIKPKANELSQGGADISIYHPQDIGPFYKR